MFKHNRKARQELYRSLKSASGATRTAKISWYLQRHESGDSGKTVTAQSAPNESLQLVRELLSAYSWPEQPKLFYTGMRHTGARMGATEVDNAVITVTGELRTPIGVQLGFDIPVEIRDGQMLEPSVMIIHGHVAVISQSAIDNLVNNNSTFADAPLRGMYSAPMMEGQDQQEAPRIPRRTPGMFHVGSKQAALREFIRTRGQNGTEHLAQMEPAPAAVDPWELDQLPNQTTPADLEVGLKQTRPGAEKCPSCGKPTRGVMPQYAPYCSGKCQQFDESTYQFDQRRRGQAQQPQPAPQQPVQPQQPGQAPAQPAAGQPSKPQMSPQDAVKGLQSIVQNIANSVQQGQGQQQGQPQQGQPVQAQMQTEDPDVHLYGEDEKEEQSKPSKGREQHNNQPTSKFLPGMKVKVTKKLSAPTRGGPRVKIESGASGHVIRDMDGHGTEIYVGFEDGRKFVIPAEFLSGGTKKKAQVPDDLNTDNES
jgi:hypothetical protein